MKVKLARHSIFFIEHVPINLYVANRGLIMNLELNNIYANSGKVVPIMTINNISSERPARSDFRSVYSFNYYLNDGYLF